MIVAVEMAIGSLAALFLSWFHDGTAWPMMITMQGLVLVIVLAYMGGAKAVGAENTG